MVNAPGAEVVNVRTLTGGIASSVHALDVVERGGVRHRLVLRRHLTTEPTDDEHTRSVEHEAAVLCALQDASIPTPTFVACDPSGARAGVPALLMQRLGGRMLLTPSDPRAWRRQMAEMLPRIHAVDLVAAQAVTAPDLDELEPPPWSREPAIWRAAIAVARDTPTAYQPCFVHDDYQHFNLLWSRERLTGVVDWTFAGTGMPECDVGHCQLNLAILWGAEVAATFRRDYEVVAGRASDPYWELCRALAFLPGWGAGIRIQAGRRLRVDLAGMNGRVEDLVASILRRC